MPAPRLRPSAAASAARRLGLAQRVCALGPSIALAHSHSDSSGHPFRPSLVPAAQLGTLVVGEVVVNQKADPGAAPEGLGAVRPSVGNAVAAAAQFQEPVTVLLGGVGLGASAQGTARLPGVQEVLYAESAELAHGLAEPWTAFLLWVQQQKGFSRIISPSSAFSRSLLPRAAALLDAPMVSDVVRILGPHTFVRPIYAGNAMATVEVVPQPQPIFLTIRSTAFAPAPAAEDATPCTVTKLEYSPQASTDGPLAAAQRCVGKSKWLGQQVRAADRPELSAAKVVVSGGRGLKSAEGFAMLEALADKLGGAVGASRAAVDAGFVPNELQVGQTGKVVAPDLYVAVGISGAIQHLAGIKDSKTIVAINKDADAPIFQVADYGLVADLFQAVPELMSKVKSKT